MDGVQLASKNKDQVNGKMRIVKGLLLYVSQTPPAKPEA
jgi:hypothetical protein